ncbi:hypothetical protein AWRI1631_100250 [Saccharomyces cerevisiae AWRI1631]|uniref:Uncharacterized protein n=1 Tax=Saccharomyces cerevisiae (strain AWRI1631) TaxID=545124 RepID=B5VL01_YEAS6|nr:hypothetical protein AWRI1631_100250 [Saccharomyces cerevisiae AWRI1631]
MLPLSVRKSVSLPFTLRSELLVVPEPRPQDQVVKPL